MIRRTTKKMMNEVYDATKQKMSMVSFDINGNRCRTHSNITILDFLLEMSKFNLKDEALRVHLLVDMKCEPVKTCASRIEEYYDYVIDINDIVKNL